MTHSLFYLTVQRISLLLDFQRQCGRLFSASTSSGLGNYLPMQSQVSYRSASSSPSAHRPSSCFHVDNEEANVPANVDVADGHADADVTGDDNDDDANDGDFDDTL